MKVHGAIISKEYKIFINNIPSMCHAYLRPLVMLWEFLEKTF
uniref:Uncharacterized protein n=1 Tax=Anguilla anguilla TaxID=7936 RepID=A0A0E9T2J9_ANGAN